MKRQHIRNISTMFSRARKQALEIMARGYDPFHDDLHVLEVEKTALRIYKKLEKQIQKRVDLELLRLACVYHDTSRKIIKTNILLQPFLDGPLSGRIAARILSAVGYSTRQAEKVRKIINSHETFLGLVKRKRDITAHIFADADFIEGYSPERMRRGLEKFLKKRFSTVLLNTYVLGMLFLLKMYPLRCHFPYAKVLCAQYKQNLRKFFLQSSTQRIFRALLLTPIYSLLYAHIDWICRK